MGQVDDLLCLPSIGHKGFLHQTGLTCHQSLTRHIEMMGVWRADIDQIHVRVSDQLCITAICFRDLPLMGEGLRLIEGS